MPRVSKQGRSAKAFKLSGIALAVAISHGSWAEPLQYENYFNELWNEIHDPANGYFSADGGPYHSIETFIVEAPDHGHQSTSEAYSYWLWLEAVKGKISGDWSHFRNAWQKMEEQIIPTDEMQPTACGYDPSSPATYIPEAGDPSLYPGALDSSVTVGVDPISADLAAQYDRCGIYGMHWLLDMDNVYGYGNLGDGVSTPSYINTFQRGEEESVWETVPHPSWEDFSFGGEYGFLDLFVEEATAPAPQWRYTNAPDADARALQVMYWVLEWLEEQGKDPNEEIPGLVEKATMMGDYLRLAMFDKYFKAMGAQSESAPAGTGFDSAHYLMSWYYAWGGPIDPTQKWGFRIGASHVHFGYQNLMAAHALTEVEALKPQTPNALENWQISLERQLEFYQWLQSKEGAIAGGATNSWNGKYDPYPPERADRTFYGMVYDEHPVYHDPGSGGWFGWQAWSVERVAEYYYITGNARAEAIMDKWIGWVMPNIHLLENGEVEVPAAMSWSGYPAPWDPENPQENTELSVTIDSWNQDIGVITSMTKALMYYAAATREHKPQEDTAVRDMSVEILNRVWDSFRTDKGLASTDTRGDYTRIYDPVYVPPGWEGTMPNGDPINNDSTFSSIRSFYENDPGYQDAVAALAAGEDPSFTYHRFWAQVDAAVAYGLFNDLFPNICEVDCPPAAIAVNGAVFQGDSVELLLIGRDSNGVITSYNVTPPAASEGSIVQNGDKLTFTPADGVSGEISFSYTVTDDEGLTSEPAGISVQVVDPSDNTVPVPCFTHQPVTAIAGKPVSFDGSCSSDADGDALSYAWDLGDGSTASGATTSHIFATPSSYDVTLTVTDKRYGLELSQAELVKTVAVIQQPEGTSCTMGSIDSWNGGMVINGISVTNVGEQALDGWQATLEFDRPVQVTGNWGASATASGNSIILSGNQQLAPGASVGGIGLQASYAGSAITEAQCLGTADDAAPAPSASFTGSVDGLSLSLDASASFSPEGYPLTYQWDLGDGSSSNGVLVSHEYAASGSYEVVLTISDGQGGEDQASESFSVSDGLPSAPVASFTYQVDGLTVSVDASGSSDADDDIVSYDWDFGDGSLGSDNLYTHSYAEEGTYNVTLTVTDATGLSDQQVQQVVVEDQQPLPAISCSYDVGNEWGSGFQASITLTNNSNTAVEGWEVSWQYDDGTTVGNAWNVVFSGNNPYLATPLSWNNNIAPGASFSFGFQGSNGAGVASIPTLGGSCQ